MSEDSPKLPEEKDNKSPWTMRLTEILIKVLGGSGFGALVTLGATQDLPKLALGGAIGGALAPIGLAVLEPISKKLKQGAGYVGEATASGTEDAAQKWWTGLSGFEHKYLQALKVYCRALEVEGLRADLVSLALTDVVIPLCLATSHSHIYGQAKTDLTIWHFLPKAGADEESSSTKLAIVANPGYGKTTLTRYLALSYSSPTYENEGATKLLPMLLRFRDIHKSIKSDGDPKLDTLLIQNIKALPTCGELQVTESWMKQQLKDGKCLVMLDGLDEVPEARRETLSRWAKRQMQEYSSSFFILTSRPHGYDQSLFQGVQVQVLKILDFTNDQKRVFLEKWYRIFMWRQKWEFLSKENQHSPEHQRLFEEQNRAQSDTEAQKAAIHLYRQIIGNLEINKQLAVNPLLLTIIAATHYAFEALPERRVKLYQKMFDLLLADRPNRRDTGLKLPETTQNQAVLQTLALNLTTQGEIQFTSKKGTNWIQASLADHCSDSTYKPQQFLEDIEQVAGLLIGGGSDLYQFAHKTFQEYLVAVEIQTQGRQSLLRDRLDSPDSQLLANWSEIFSFYAALEGADWLVQPVSDMPEGEKKQQSLELLYRIVKEEKSQIKDPRLQQHLDEMLATVQFTGLTAAKNVLNQRFQHMILLDNQAEITANPISWREYQQFLEAQNTGQFHSIAQPKTILPEQLDLPVTEISQADCNWFCAWLPTQTGLKADDQLFVYDLPSHEQYRQAGIAEDENLYVVRRPTDPKYDQLLNYLASASWREADRETYRLMITTVGKEDGQPFERVDLENFPYKDLRSIDQLWVKYSNSRWGFSVQKRIWQGYGKPMSDNNDWKKFCARVGWRKNNAWVRYNDLTFDLKNSLEGEFASLGGGEFRKWWYYSILARADL